MKSFVPILVAVCSVCSLSAQTESPKSKPFGSVTAAPSTQKPAAAGPKAVPPTVKEPGKAPAEMSPPPAIPAATPAAEANATKPKIDKHPPAFDVKNMDTSIKPSDDFFTYANGTWLKKTPIPPEESRWGSFQ